MLNNSYLGLIRQSQRSFDMDYCVQLSFDNVNSPELGGYGVDHVKVAEGLGCKALRVSEPHELATAIFGIEDWCFAARVLSIEVRASQQSWSRRQTSLASR